MARGTRVQTGCPNCKRCTNSAVNEGARKAGRAYIGVATLGMSELAMSGTKNCRTCGHKMSLHTEVSAQPSVVVVQGGGPAAAPETSWAGSPSGSDSASRARKSHAQQQFEFHSKEADKWEARIAELEDKGKTGMVLSHARKNAERHREATEKWAARAQGSAGSEEAWVDAEAVDDDLTPMESTAASTPAQATSDVPAQLMKLKDLHDAGVLTDAEFDTKKAELLDRM